MTSEILKKIVHLLLPLIQVFAIYVVLFGHLSPGGGFAGGTILGTSFIIDRFVNGELHMKSKINQKHAIQMVGWSLFIYAFIKGTTFILPGVGIHVKLPLGTPGRIFSGGLILPLNILVGIIVALTFYLIVALFDEGEEKHENAID